MKTLFRMAPALLLLAATGACDRSALDVLPEDATATDVAIKDMASATAALMGGYSSLQDLGYYGVTYIVWPEVMSDNAEHTGTYGDYGQADLLTVPANNYDVEDIWNSAYDGINRVNEVLKRVPGLDNVDQSDKDWLMGQAYALRAFHYFSLVRGYGGVPLVLEPPASLDEASQVSRATATEVYAQIIADLGQAATLMASAGMDNSDRSLTTPGFVDALLSKVYLYQQNWSQAETAAMRLVNSGDYDLASDFGSLWADQGTPEDIFKITFTSVDYNEYGFYYQYDGRFETGATMDIYTAYDSLNDLRWAATFDGTRNDGIQVVKFPTTAGTEDFNVIRYGEVLLIVAEAAAEQNDLTTAVTYLNMVHTRAGLTALDLATDLNNSQQDVLDAIHFERRLELAFEGDRWFEIVRLGLGPSVFGSRWAADNHMQLWPLPVSELDVAPNLVQNPGYEN
ncbi:MAG: RagB/SusD family nutrient uptake outer membrane protein [Gemmatimonadota bacterium]